MNIGKPEEIVTIPITRPSKTDPETLPIPSPPAMFQQESATTRSVCAEHRWKAEQAKDVVVPIATVMASAGLPWSPDDKGT